MTKTIVVTGATGQVGGAVVRALAADGFEVRAATREPDTYKGGKNVVPVRFDYHAKETIGPALAGADGLFLIALPLDPTAPELLRPVIDQARVAGVKQIVFNSALGVDRNEAAPLRIVERYLMDSGVPYTILRPNFFMENFTSGSLGPMINEGGGLYLAAGDGKTSFISTGDIAAVAVDAFKQRLVGQAFDLTGPEALDHYQVAAIISEAAGRPIPYEPQDEDDFLDMLGKRGLPDTAARYLADLYGAVRSGLMAWVTGDVLMVTGRAPVSFAAFAKRHADDWVPAGEHMPPPAAVRPVAHGEVHRAR
jgi:uncharacterized protein YbjT (DUF2867 family)